MTGQATETTVTKTIDVAASAEHAFSVFTDGFAEWWPPTHHIAEHPMETAVIEPHAGGRWFERAADGSECDWGRVLAWDPPHRLVLTWHLDASFSYDPDPDRASDVEVRFEPTGERTTRVVLEHRHLERHGGDIEKMRAAIDAPDGWNGILVRFAEAAAG